MESTVLQFLTGVLVLINSAQIIYQAWKKFKPEVKKLDAEVDSEIVEAANLNLEGTKVSTTILLDRVNELKLEVAQVKKDCREQIQAIEQARKEDIEYFRRRVKDLERDNRDWRGWAAKLAKQVVEAGLIPAPFIPSIDTEVGMQRVRPDLENKIGKNE